VLATLLDAEFAVTRTPDLTIKINIWYRPDLRCG
jgi:hypothetical protein